MKTIRILAVIFFLVFLILTAIGIYHNKGFHFAL